MKTFRMIASATFSGILGLSLYLIFVNWLYGVGQPGSQSFLIPVS